MKTVCPKHQQAYEINQGCPYCPALVVSPAVRTILTPSVLANHFASIEARGSRVARVWLNATGFAELRQNGRDIVDFETRTAFMQRGLMGYVWAAEIWVSRKIPVGYAMLIAVGSGNGDLSPIWVPDSSKLLLL